jgi:hypothetical protein
MKLYRFTKVTFESCMLDLAGDEALYLKYIDPLEELKFSIHISNFMINKFQIVKIRYAYIALA